METHDNPEKLDLASSNITDDQRAKLKALFPEAFTEAPFLDAAHCRQTTIGRGPR